MKTQIETLRQDEINARINEFLSELSTDYTTISDYVGADDITDYSSAWDTISNIMSGEPLNVDIIYYATAMEYIQQRDPSLQESLGIALELGYTCENVNSELLASILATRDNEELFYELEDEVEEFFNDLEEEIDEWKNDAINILVDEYGQDYTELELDIDELSDKVEELQE